MDVTLIERQLQQLMDLKEELLRQNALLQSQNAQLQSDYQALLASTQTLMKDRELLERRMAELEAINKRLTDMLWGRRTERRDVNPDQLLLGLPGDESAEDQQVIVAQSQAEQAIDAELIARDERRRQKQREQKRSEEFPAHLERRETILDLSDQEKAGLKYIGDAVTERMRFEKPQVYIQRIVRRKYVVEGQPQEGVKAPRAPLAIVEGCKYDFSVIAAMLALKYAFHQPTYRQQDWFAQCGWFPSRSTINDLLNVSVQTVQPLVAQMWWELLRQSILLVDETRVLLLTRNSLTAEQEEQLRRRKRSKPPDDDSPPELDAKGSVTSYAWLFSGRDGCAPYNVFHWSLTRQQTTIDELLADYRGIVVADAYDAYAHIAKRSGGRIEHASCNTHARREFVQAEVYQPILCAQIRSLYKQLYALEDQAATMSDAGRLELRQREEVAIWRRIEAWLDSDAVRQAALPQSYFGKAVTYLRNQWTALRRYLGDGRIPMTNDQAEQTIRPLTIGRRNWLFLGHPAAAPGRMQLLSVISSAHRHHLLVEDYLEDVLRKLAEAQQQHPADLEVGSEYLRELLPDRWAASHPASIRHERARERQVVTDIKRARRARERQQQRRRAAR